MTDTNYLPGTRIRYKLDNLGLIGQPGTVSKDEQGTVIGPAPDDGWIFTEPDSFPATICPVSAGMIEAAS
jgi:hypothetical protein